MSTKPQIFAKIKDLFDLKLPHGVTLRSTYRCKTCWKNYVCKFQERERKKQSRKRRFFIWLLNVYKVSWCDWQLMCQNKMRKEKWARLCSIKTQMLDTMKVSFIYSRLSMDWSAFWSGNQSPFGCSGVTHSSISFRFIKKSSIQKTNTTPFPAWFR